MVTLRSYCWSRTRAQAVGETAKWIVYVFGRMTEKWW